MPLGLSSNSSILFPVSLQLPSELPELSQSSLVSSSSLVAISQADIPSSASVVLACQGSSLFGESSDLSTMVASHSLVEGIEVSLSVVISSACSSCLASLPWSSWDSSEVSSGVRSSLRSLSQFSDVLAVLVVVGSDSSLEFVEELSELLKSSSDSLQTSKETPWGSLSLLVSVPKSQIRSTVSPVVSSHSSGPPRQILRVSQMVVGYPLPESKNQRVLSLRPSGGPSLLDSWSSWKSSEVPESSPSLGPLSELSLQRSILPLMSLSSLPEPVVLSSVPLQLSSEPSQSMEGSPTATSSRLGSVPLAEVSSSKSVVSPTGGSGSSSKVSSSILIDSSHPS